MTRLVGLIGLLWALVEASAQTVEFPLNYYSFAEIAQRLSVGERTVQCARDLQQRLVLIHLKPREWQQARALLEHALDIRLRKTSDAENRWILERDPDTARRERRLRERLAKLIETRLRQREEETRDLLESLMPPDAALRTLLGYAPDSESARRAAPTDASAFWEDIPLQSVLRSWRAYLRLKTAYQAFKWQTYSSAEGRGLSEEQIIQRFMEAHPLSEFGFSSQELEWARQQTQSSVGQAWLYLPVRHLSLETPELAHWQALQMMDALLELYLQVWLREAIQQRGGTRASILECLEQGVIEQEITLELPAELAAWLVGDAEGAVVTIQGASPVPLRLAQRHEWGRYGHGYALLTFPLTPQSPAQANPMVHLLQQNLSLRFEPDHAVRDLQSIDPEYAQQYDAAYQRHQELLKDDKLRQPFRTELNFFAPLMERVRLWAYESQQEVILEALRPFSRARGSSLAECPQRAQQPWLLEQRDGVWLLRCWTAFVERMPDYPLAALRDLFQSARLYPDWRRFYQSTTPMQIRWLLQAESVAPFSGRTLPSDLQRAMIIDQTDLAEAWLIMGLLEILPEAERERLWRTAQSVPLSRWSVEERSAIAQVLRLWRAALLSPLVNHKIRKVFYSDIPIEQWLAQAILVRASASWSLEVPSMQGQSASTDPIILWMTDLPAEPPAENGQVPNSTAGSSTR